MQTKIRWIFYRGNRDYSCSEREFSKWKHVFSSYETKILGVCVHFDDTVRPCKRNYITFCNYWLPLLLYLVLSTTMKTTEGCTSNIIYTYGKQIFFRKLNRFLFWNKIFIAKSKKWGEKIDELHFYIKWIKFYDYDSLYHDNKNRQWKSVTYL